MATNDPNIQMMMDDIAASKAAQVPSQPDPVQTPVSTYTDSASKSADPNIDMMKADIAATQQAHDEAKAKSDADKPVDDAGYYGNQIRKGAQNIANMGNSIWTALGRSGVSGGGEGQLYDPTSQDDKDATRAQIAQQGASRSQAIASAPIIGTSDRPDYQPSNEISRIGGRAVEGAITALPAIAAAPFTGGISLGTLAAPVVAGAAGGAVGETARYGAQSAGMNQTVQNAADIAGNLVGGGATALRMGAANPELQNLTSLGITARTPSMAGGLTGDVLNAGARSTPFLGKGLINAQAAKAGTQFGDATTGILDSIEANPTDKLSLGQDIQHSANDYVAGTKVDNSAAYDAITPQTSSTVKVRPTNLLDATGHTLDMPSGNIIPKQLNPAQRRMLPDGSADIATDLKEYGTGGMNYAELQEYKKGLIKSGADPAHIAAINKDIEAVANANGPQVGQAFNDAQTQFGQSANFAREQLQGKTAPNQPNNINVLTQPNGATLTNKLLAPQNADQLNSLIDQGVIGKDQLASLTRQHLQSLASDRQGNISAAALAKNIAEPNPTTEALVSRMDPTTQASWNKLQQASKYLTGNAKLPNPGAEKTGLAHLVGLDTAKDIGLSAMEGGTHGAAHIATGGTLLGGAVGLTTLSTRPWFINAMARQYNTPAQFATALTTGAKFHKEDADEANDLAAQLRAQ